MEVFTAVELIGVLFGQNEEADHAGNALASRKQAQDVGDSGCGEVV